jgi:peptide-methionine (S)-S-oxide reductase
MGTAMFLAANRFPRVARFMSPKTLFHDKNRPPPTATSSNASLQPPAFQEIVVSHGRNPDNRRPASAFRPRKIASAADPSPAGMRKMTTQPLSSPSTPPSEPVAMLTRNLSPRDIVAAAALVACTASVTFWAVKDASGQSHGEAAAETEDQAVKPGHEQVTFGSGCFWCTEAFFAELKGVDSAVSGYSGGVVENPTYEQVCTGLTGHAEVVQVTYDPKVISFADLLAVFWQTHDPTTLNQQGPDYGTQYRSAIFYHTEEQRKEAEHFKQKLDESGAFDAPVVTEITPFEVFYPAEDYHQEYFAANPRADYCRAVIAPKMKKFRRVFADKLKTDDE